eukprot:TRINITY_DN44966_c0_g1_i1.p2 TRINITY_DN44966_c0_g1~~TRINITY_DN44966_c0_g1_i1.p2  ORF type:complete len:189 (-),score=31.89 TRINITY_DN44966_c0_g1_i1:48-614(-)
MLKLKQSLPAFNFGLKNYKSQNEKQHKLEKTKRKVSVSLEKNEIIQISKKRERIHSFCKPQIEIPQIPGQNAFYNLIEYKSLGSGGIFGTKAFEYLPRQEKLAKMTFVADSFQTQIYILEESDLNFIPDYLVKILKDGLQFFSEADNVNNQEENLKNRNWVKFRQGVYNKELELMAAEKPQEKLYKKH